MSADQVTGSAMRLNAAAETLAAHGAHLLGAAGLLGVPEVARNWQVPVRLITGIRAA